MQESHDIIIIGAGLSGLSVAHFLKMLAPQLKPLIVEQQSRPGGCIQTFQHDAIQAEWGPHGFLNNTEESLELLRDLGLTAGLQQAPLGNYQRFLCHRGRLVPLPQSPLALLRTPLLSGAAKLRLLADLWRKPKDHDQSIGDWAAHRFGRGVLPMVDAAVTGTFAGDPNRLSIDAVMPGIRQLEKDAGSVLRGLIRRKRGQAAPRKGLPAMLNFPKGMETLSTALARDKQIRYGCAIDSISRQDQRWQLACGTTTLTARCLVLALPVNNALTLLAGLAPPTSAIPTARLANVVMAFGPEAKVPYGFGYLAPEREQRFAMGAMFSSHMFPDRVPTGNVLLEVLVGGRRHPERLELSDDELISRALADIKTLMTLPNPWFTKVLRPGQGIPQLEMDHPALLAWRQRLAGEQPDLHLCGFGWDGIGMNEMMKAAKRTAVAIGQGGRQAGEEQQKVKPVYF